MDKLPMGLLKLITKGRTTTSFALQSYKAPLEAVHVHTPGPQDGLASCHTLPALGIRGGGGGANRKGGYPISKLLVPHPQKVPT